jgi:hypothetical protein
MLLYQIRQRSHFRLGASVNNEIGDSGLNFGAVSPHRWCEQRETQRILEPLAARIRDLLTGNRWSRRFGGSAAICKWLLSL